MKKVFHLSSCSTCQRIIKEINFPVGTIFQDIKEEPIQEDQLEELKTLAGSYEALFSRRAIKFRSLSLNKKVLSEMDYKRWILEEYTFLKRPVIVLEDNIFIGNAKKTVDSIKAYLS